MRTFLAVVALFSASAAGPAAAQPKPDAPVQRYELLNGSVIQHLQYDGVLLRLDRTGRQTARVKLPKSGFEESTRLAVSKSEEKLLVVYSGSTSKWPPKHKVLLLDAVSLEKVLDLPLGDCEFIDFVPFAETQRLLCQQSKNPSDRKAKPTLAFVALDVNRGAVITWFELGGERRGNWLGPMFFGYGDSAFRVRVEPGRCVVQAEQPTPRSPEDTNYYQSDASLIETFDLTERPSTIIVVGRHDGPSKGDVWFVGAGAADSPRRVGTLNRQPYFAGVCGDQLQLVLSRE